MYFSKFLLLLSMFRDVPECSEMFHVPEFSSKFIKKFHLFSGSSMTQLSTLVTILFILSQKNNFSFIV